MAGRHLIGAAGVALAALTSANSAQAADVMPIIPVVTPVVVVPAGPVFEINIETWIEADFEESEFDPEVFTEASLKLTTASGWGFELIAGAQSYILPPPQLQFALTGRAFRSAGDFEFGAYAGASFGFYGLAYWVGGDFLYDTDRLTLDGYVQANFLAPGGFEFMQTEANLAVHVTDKLDIGAGILFGTDFALFDLDGYVGAQYDFGLLAPYVQVWFDEGLEVDLGVELEHQFGDSPLALLGYAEVELDGGGPEVYLGIGIRFSRGGTD